MNIQTFLILLVLTMALPQYNSRAGLWQTCGALIKKVARQQDLLSAEQVQLIKADLKTFTVGPITALGNYSLADMYFVFQHLPKSIQDIIRNTPKGRHRRLFSEIRMAIHPQASIIDSVLWNIDKHIYHDELVSDILDNAGRKYTQLDRRELEEIKLRLREKYLISNAERMFNQHFFINLNIITKSGRKCLAVKDELYPITSIREGQLIIEVPAQQVVHPNWNPLNFHEWQKYSTGASALDLYRVEIGLDGKFYLQDGNHRFAYLETRPVISVEIASTQTMTLRRFFDAFGVVQPGTQEKTDLISGDTSIMESLTDLLRRVIIWQESDFVRPTSGLSLPDFLQ